MNIDTFTLASAGAQQMNTETDERRAYIESIMNRLRRHYAERTPLPGREDDEALTLQLLQRLYRNVMSEGYGE
jgi:hypothetical protein